MLLLLPAQPVVGGNVRRDGAGSASSHASTACAQLGVAAQAQGEARRRRGRCRARRAARAGCAGAGARPGRRGGSRTPSAGLDQPDALDVAQHARRPAGGLRGLVDRQRVHRRRNLTTVVSRFARDAGQRGGDALGRLEHRPVRRRRRARAAARRGRRSAIRSAMCAPETGSSMPQTKPAARRCSRAPPPSARRARGGRRCSGSAGGAISWPSSRLFALHMSALSAARRSRSANVGRSAPTNSSSVMSALIFGPCSGSSSASWIGCGRCRSG